MARIFATEPVICDGCGVEVTWAPIIASKRTYCCRDCSEGRPCQCDYPPEEEREQEAVYAPVVMG